MPTSQEKETLEEILSVLQSHQIQNRKKERRNFPAINNRMLNHKDKQINGQYMKNKDLINRETYKKNWECCDHSQILHC